MFKKNFTQTSNSLLSGKDVKRLKTTIENAYQCSDDEMGLLFPGKAEASGTEGLRVDEKLAAA